jgi:hypothetical protein
MKHGHKKGHKKHHRGGSYRIHNPDYKILAMAGAAGIVAAIGAAYLQANVTFFKTYWYALPLAFIVGGFGLLYLKMPTLGIALAGVGGLLGYTAYQAQAPSGQGFTEAGRMGMRADSGLYERQAGAILGSARQQMRASQQAGAILGGAKAGMRAGQRAAGFADAGGLNDAAGLNAA